MNSLEITVVLIGALFGGLSVGAAFAASRHYRARRRERRTKLEAHRRSSAIEQLERWRNEGVLIIEDEALEAALYWKGADPAALERLVHFIETILAEEDVAGLKLAVKEPDQEHSIKRGPPRGLDLLITGFGHPAEA